jgi:hypothetical protein
MRPWLHVPFKGEGLSFQLAVSIQECGADLFATAGEVEAVAT